MSVGVATPQVLGIQSRPLPTSCLCVSNPKPRGGVERITSEKEVKESSSVRVEVDVLVAVDKQPLTPSIEEHEGQCCNFAVKCHSLEEVAGKEEKIYPMELDVFSTRDDKSLTCTELEKHCDMMVAGIVVAGGVGAAARLDISSSQPIILLNKTEAPPAHVGRSASSSSFSCFSTASPAAVAEPTAKAVSFTERNSPGIISLASKEVPPAGLITVLESNSTPDTGKSDTNEAEAARKPNKLRRTLTLLFPCCFSKTSH